MHDKKPFFLVMTQSISLTTDTGGDFMALRGGRKHDCAQDAADLFDNMRVPAALFAGAIVPLVSFAGPRHSASDSSLMSILKRVHFIFALASFCNALSSCVYATVAVNSLTEREVPPAESVAEVLQRD